MEIMRNDRRGIALAAAILALVIIGALVTGGFYAASQEARVSRSSKYAGRAFYVAEQGIHRTLANMDRQMLAGMERNETLFVDFQADDQLALFDLLNLGSVDEHSDTIMINGRPAGAFKVTIRRMDNNPGSADDRLYWIRSEGEILEGGRYAGAERAVGVMVRTRSIAFPMNTAMQISGPLEVGGNATIDGSDHDPWAACPNTGTQEAGILSNDTTTVDTHGNPTIEGDPPIEEDPTLNDEDFTQFGDISFEDLAAYASKVYPPAADVTDLGPVASSDACTTSIMDNWGAPLDESSPCHFYFPIIYAEGDLHISGHGAGQGILLVEGNLTMTGGGEFYGIVIVKGGFHTSGTGGHLNGAILVKGDATLEVDTGTTEEESEATGNSIINFSSCAIQRAQTYNDLARFATPLARRSWVDLSAAGA